MNQESESMSFISLQNAEYRYTPDELALCPTTLDIQQGEFVCVLGPSGCGKSTMMNMLAGVKAPSAGRVVIDGQEMFGPGSPAFPPIGYVFQDHRLLPWRNVSKNLKLVLRSAGVPEAEWNERIERYLTMLEIEQFRGSWPLKLSGGQRQRAAIARALAIEPAYLLMDEPFSTLDEVTGRTLRKALHALWQDLGSTIVFVTHSIREAVFLASRIVIFSRGPGRIIEDFQVEQADDPEDPRLARLEAEIVDRVMDVWTAVEPGQPEERARIEGPAA